MTNSPFADTREVIATALELGGANADVLESSVNPGSDQTAVFDFVMRTIEVREQGRPKIKLETFSATGARRGMRIAIVNDDMPFLVDSVAAIFSRRRIDVHRLSHPILRTLRNEAGQLQSFDLNKGLPESLIHLETEWIHSKLRRGLADEIAEVLGDVRQSVLDWPRMRAAIGSDAASLEDAEGSALMRWFMERHFTMLGHRREDMHGNVVGQALGLLARPGTPALTDASRAKAMQLFRGGRAAPLIIKSDRRSTVHRDAPLDMLVLPFRSDGSLTGLSLHLGLWTSAALRAEPDQIPIIRERLSELERKHRIVHGTHSGKALRHALAALPHDLLIGMDADQIERLVLAATSLPDRPRPKLVVSCDPIGRRLSAFAWLHRQAFSPRRRVGIQRLLERDTGGRVEDWSVDQSEGQLIMLSCSIVRDPEQPLVDTHALAARFEVMMRGWNSALKAELVKLVGLGRATRATITWAASLPSYYRDTHVPEAAAPDILRLVDLNGPDERGVRLFRRDSDGPLHARLKLYRLGGLVPLSAAVPVLENFGFVVLDHVPTPLKGGALGFIHEFTIRLPDALAAIDECLWVPDLETAIAATLEGKAENDLFNTLLLGVRTDPRGVVLLRAWFRYLRQTGVSLGISTIVDALRRSPEITRDLLSLFASQHDPSYAGPTATEALQAVEAGLLDVATIEDDRILRLFRDVIGSIVRTNAFGPAAQEALAFKLDSSAVPNLPKPRPWREIWVYSPRVEGIHLRGGPIARGGLRWSDRRDDFRTEILGLMKAQLVKNAIIVPTGAKGGFFPKRLPDPLDREAWLEEGTSAYRTFIKALLSITDNLVDGAVVHPTGVVVRDGDDPYLVVAADKGTAAFSDIANAIAIDAGFWLGDAFASGGSIGYDHKAMGITARGAWISVQRHFAELGIDVQTQPIRAVGCGDMSGDVFGNGMLLSKALRLVAAFDHRHIFLDPDPDPISSFEERARLYALPRSSWADYDRSLISPGGGVFARTSKRIRLTSQVRDVLGVAAEELDPAALISAILLADVDLLWFGGIGTYVKAEAETHATVRDPANDALRVDAGELRARVIGEGANLGITQAARVAFAASGGRINTDFIDNSAGVGCSDNEVNIKIALNSALAERRLSEAGRAELLAGMTDEVAAIVLEDNRLQTLALSLAEVDAAKTMPAHIRLINRLELAGRFDRTVEGIESDAVLQQRDADHRGFTRPELAVLMSHAKLALQQALEASGVPASSRYQDVLSDAFPASMRAAFAGDIQRHRLAPQIVATKIANRVVNRLGITAAFDIAEAVNRPVQIVADAYFAADTLFGFETLFRRVEASDRGERDQLRLLTDIAQTARRQVIDILRAESGTADPWQTVARFGEGVKRLKSARADETLSDSLDGVIARFRDLDGAVGMAALAQRLDVDPLAATAAFLRLRDALTIDQVQAVGEMA